MSTIFSFTSVGDNDVSSFLSNMSSLELTRKVAIICLALQKIKLYEKNYSQNENFITSLHNQLEYYSYWTFSFSLFCTNNLLNPNLLKRVFFINLLRHGDHDHKFHLCKEVHNNVITERDHRRTPYLMWSYTLDPFICEWVNWSNNFISSGSNR